MTRVHGAVFVSHASEDGEVAARICAALRAAGIEVWFDQSELRGGETWDRQIRKQIHDCALFVAVISAHTNARTEGYFRREWRLAVDRTHDMADDAAFLLPVVIDDTSEATARVPEPFRDVQWTHLPAGRGSASTLSPAYWRCWRHARPRPAQVPRVPAAVPDAALAPGAGAVPRDTAGMVAIHAGTMAARDLVVFGCSRSAFALGQFGLAPRGGGGVSARTTNAPAMSAVPGAAAAAPEQSIAVLPFST